MQINTQVMFSEGHAQFRPIPDWVRAMIKLGYQWSAGAGRARRVGLVSMPCDSPAFGLITLGLMMRDLGRAEATDIHLHHQRVVDYARRFLEQQRTKEEITESQKLSGILKLIPKDPSQKAVRYKVVGVTGGPDPSVKVRQLQAKSKLNGSELAEIVFSKHRTQRLSIEGAPVPDVRMDERAIEPASYQMLLTALPLEHTNLQQSYTGLCIAGRAEGERPTRAVLEQSVFEMQGAQYSLDEMLCVEGWTGEMASRTRYINTRGNHNELDIDNAPEIIVVDGLQAFTKVINNPKLQYTDVILVYHRTVDRDLLEELGSQIDNLQRYLSHIETQRIPEFPTSIHHSVLEG